MEKYVSMSIDRTMRKFEHGNVSSCVQLWFQWDISTYFSPCKCKFWILHQSFFGAKNSLSYNHRQNSWNTLIFGGNFELRSPLPPNPHCNVRSWWKLIDEFTHMCSAINQHCNEGRVAKVVVYMQERHLSTQNSFVSTSFVCDCRLITRNPSNRYQPSPYSSTLWTNRVGKWQWFLRFNVISFNLFRKHKKICIRLSVSYYLCKIYTFKYIHS